MGMAGPGGGTGQGSTGQGSSGQEGTRQDGGGQEQARSAEDARLLIDVTTVAHEHARPYLPGELSKQVDQALGQLRMGQVSAEGQASRQGKPEENDLDRMPAPPAAGAAR